MKFWRRILISLISLCLIAISQVPISRALTPKASVLLLKVKSLEKDFPIRSVYVLTPAVPTSEVSQLPIVYMLHGWPGTPAGFMSGVQSALNVAFAKGARPFIAVFPDGNALTHSDSEWADSYDGHAEIESWPPRS